MPALTVAALPGVPLVRPGDDLLPIIQAALERAAIVLQDDDALVITSKIVSKAEGRLVALAEVEPRDEALQLAEETGKDPRIVELVLRESVYVSRKARNLLVVEHRLGFISANAGIDQSNIGGDDAYALLMPYDPDGTARRIHDALRTTTGKHVAVIISDSHGRPFRMGNVGVAIGVAGMPGLLDLRGERDLYGRELRNTQQGYADLVASAASLVSGEGSEGYPLVHVRGLRFPRRDGSSRELIRLPEQDLYR